MSERALPSRSEPSDLLFVYGTLLRGERLAHELSGRIAGDVRLAVGRGVLLDLGDYPGLVLDAPDAGPVRGELVVLAHAATALAALDEVEGFIGGGHRDNLYERRRVTVRSGDGALWLAWTYVFVGDREGARPIASGDWRARVAPRGTLGPESAESEH